jgi:NADPH:quinone reductase
MTNSIERVEFNVVGGPEVLVCRAAELPTPSAGQVQVSHRAIGVNFLDTYHRSGLYPLPLPATPGVEAAGVIVAIGEGVTGFSKGDRVAWLASPGAYASSANVPADRVVPIPDGISFETAACAMVKGMTAEFLLHRTIAVQPGDTILVHAAAGGVGSLLVQWGAKLGATVIGTVGSTAKAEFARSLGAHHLIEYRTESVVDRVRELTNGRGVRVVYDGVGKDTLTQSLQCVQRRGLLVSFGQASGMPDPIALSSLSAQGSIYVTRPTLFHYVAERAELLESASRVFDALQRGWLTIPITARFALRDAAEAHELLEGRQTTGAVVLVPEG